MAVGFFIVLNIFMSIGFVLTTKCHFTVEYYDTITGKTSLKNTATYCQNGYSCCEQVQTKCCKDKTSSTDENTDEYKSSGHIGPTFISVLSIILGCVFGILIFIVFVVLVRRLCCKDITKKSRPRSTTTREVRGRRAVYIYKARFPKGEKPEQPPKSKIKQMIEKKKSQTSGTDNKAYSDDDDEGNNSSIASTASSPAYSNMKHKTSYASYQHADGRVVYVATSSEDMDKIVQENEDGYMTIADETTDFGLPRTARSSSSVNFADESDCASFYGGSTSSIETHTRSENVSETSNASQNGKRRKKSKFEKKSSSVSLQSPREEQSNVQDINGSAVSLKNTNRRISSTSETGITFTAGRTKSCVSLSSGYEQDLPIDGSSTARCSSPLPDNDVPNSLHVLESIDLHLQELKVARPKHTSKNANANTGDYLTLEGPIETHDYDELENVKDVARKDENDQTENKKQIKKSNSDMSIFLAKSPVKDGDEQNVVKSKKKKNFIDRMINSKSSPSIHKETNTAIAFPQSSRGGSSSADDEESSAANDDENNRAPMATSISCIENKHVIKKGKKRKASKNIDVNLTPTINEEDVFEEQIPVGTKRSLSLPMQEEGQHGGSFSKRSHSLPTGDVDINKTNLPPVRVIRSSADITDDTVFTGDYLTLEGPIETHDYDELENVKDVARKDENDQTENKQLIKKSNSDMSIFLAKSPVSDGDEQNVVKSKKKKNFLDRLINSKSSPSIHKETNTAIAFPQSSRGGSSSADDEESSAANDDENNRAPMATSISCIENKQVIKKGKKRKASKNIDVNLTPTINEEDVFEDQIPVGTKRSLSLPMHEEGQHGGSFSKRSHSSPTGDVDINKTNLPPVRVIRSSADITDGNDHDYLELDLPKKQDINASNV